MSPNGDCCLKDLRLRRAETAYLFILSALLCGLLVYKARHGGITVDEPAHIVSSYCFWTTGQTLPPRDMPPLIRLAGGWTTLFSGVPLNPADCRAPSGAPANEWDLAATFATRLTAPQAKSILTAARIPLIVFPLGTILLAWLWARQAGGPAVAAATALLIALSPTIRGHGAIFKNDEAATFAYLFFFFVVHKYWMHPRWSLLAALAFAVSFCAAAKYSLLIVAPLALAAVLWRGPGRRLYRTAALVFIAYAALCLWFLPETGILSPQHRRTLRATEGIPYWFTTAIAPARVIPTPLPAIDGIASLFVSNHFASPVYLFGEHYSHGHPAYFLVVLFYKLPLPLHILLTLLLARSIWNWRRGQPVPAALFWLLPSALFLLGASASKLQLGVRLILPALPFLYLACGETLAWLAARRTLRPIAAVLLLWMAIQSARAFPNGIGFVNLAGGTAEDALYLFSDSNLDWGQALPELAAYARREHIPHLHIAYFGFDNPYFYFPDNQVTSIPLPWNLSLTSGRTRYDPAPGLYAISATALTGQHFPPELRDYFAPFRSLRPRAVIANSIFVYAL
jgi:hypothetical protein